ncbi:hypothetical protein CPB83DRAFT_809463, partial [Crepidotus variabilis]
MDLSLLNKFASFAPRTKSNNPLSAEDDVELRQLLRPTFLRLDELHREIEQLRALSRRKQEEHDALVTVTSRMKSLISSPIRKLPSDILASIFTHCLPSTHNAPIHPDHAPLLLTQICGSWRSLAFSTPQLWASIH